MEPWRSQHFRKFAKEKGAIPHVVNASIAVGKALTTKSPNSPPIFSLKHLAYSAEVKYRVLREAVERKTPERYRIFKIQKRTDSGSKVKRYRMICVPDPQLMKAQRWIAQNILPHGRTHDASVAYKPGSNIVDAASLHCGCKWLIKMDIVNFFESVTERSVYRVFHEMGYQPLVSFELARVCTRKGDRTWVRNPYTPKWQTWHATYSEILSYTGAEMLGHLPQGAPTSPMLANLSMYDFDQSVEEIAAEFGLTYTRYADDLTLSTASDNFSRAKAQEAVSRIYRTIREFSFEPNFTKTQIVPPGARRVVLGLLVDGERPKLTKQFRDRLRLHLHHIGPNGAGAIKHAERNHFQSVFGLRNHIEGLISFAHSVDPGYARNAWEEFNKAEWP